MPSTAAVIGAGALGLSAMKNLRDEGFDVTGFESRDYVGGLWKYNADEHLSVQSSTIFNSSRYRCAFTDFPFDDDVDDFPTWQQIFKYLNNYADHYGLREMVRLNTYVTSVKRDDDEWVVEYKSKDGAKHQQKFSRLIIATGSFNKPKIPHLEGIEQFEGQALHAINFHDPEKYKGQNVLLVGLHATTSDVTSCLAGNAKQVYLSHRNGVHMVSKYGNDGAVFDAAQNVIFTSLVLAIETWAPRFWDWLFNKMISMMSKQAFPDVPESWKMSPAPPVYVSNPLIADEIYPLMDSGFAQPVTGVRRVTGPKSIELTDGTCLQDIDSIIYCTGYDLDVPFLEPEYNPYPVTGQMGNLYRNMFLLHPDEKVRNSLGFVGHAAIIWPGFSLFELQGLAISQIFSGKSSLPSYDEMQQWHSNLVKWRRDRLARNTVPESTSYIHMVPSADHFQWLENTSGTDVMAHFGWGPKAWAFWWTDREFYNLCSKGLFSPALFRLFETGKRKAWAGAREQILKDNELAKKQVEQRKAYLKTVEGKKKT